MIHAINLYSSRFPETIQNAALFGTYPKKKFYFVFHKFLVRYSFPIDRALFSSYNVHSIE